MSQKVFVKEIKDIMIFYSDDKNDMKRVSKNFPGRWSESFKKAKLCTFAEDKGRVIGASCIRGVFNIWSTYVVKEYRGQGIGRALLKNMIITAKRKNCRFVIGTIGWLGEDYNIPARKMARKVGGFGKVADIERITIIMWPLKTISGNFAFLCACTLFSLIPQTFRKKMLMLALQFS